MSSPSLALYKAAMAAFEPFAPLVLQGRARRGKEDPLRLPERLGRPSQDRPSGKLVWLHGVSVGESLSLLPLIDRIRAERPDLALLVTTGTVTSAALLAKRLPVGVIHQYAPVDGPKATASFLSHWRPDLGLFAESELWPNLILTARAQGARLALVSARITARTAQGWKSRPAAAKALLSAFSLILPQDAASGARLADLGARPGPELNLKYIGDPLPCDTAELARLKVTAAGRKVVVAASTHPGEDELIATASPPDALLILVPRHPNRGPEIEATLSQMGLTVARRSTGADLDRGRQVYIADTLGEMGLFLRLADIVVMGGSFVPNIGGHNPLEPARLERAIVSGGDIYNFADVYAGMSGAGAVVMTSDLSAALADLLTDGPRRKVLAKAAADFAAHERSTFENGFALIRDLLP